jgi:hypothetical protein
LNRLEQVLGHFDDLTVAALCSRLDDLAARGSQLSRTPRAIGKSARNEGVIEKYGTALSSDELTYSALFDLIGELRADKKAKLPELTAIASRLSGVDGVFKNKTAALEKIEAVVRRRLDTGRRLEGTSGIF